MLSAGALWLLRIVSALHWQVVFVGGAAATNPIAVSLLDQLELGYRLLAFAALVFNVALPPTLLAVSGAMIIQ